MREQRLAQRIVTHRSGVEDAQRLPAAAAEVDGRVEGVAAIALLHGAKSAARQLQHAFAQKGHIFRIFQSQKFFLKRCFIICINHQK